mgnify:FL=1
MASIFDYVKKAKEYYDEYKGLIDTAGSAGKAYLDYKDQKRRNELDEQAYRDYMLEKESAGQEAQTAVDINLTPMEVTGVPTSKADVTSFQAVANGGIIGLKNGGAPNAGIAALRKKAPGVVKRMGFYKGTGENGVMDINVDTNMKMADYEPGVPTTGDLYDMNNPDYKGINKKVIIEFIEEGIPLGYSSPEEYYEDFYGIMGSKNKENTNKKMAEIPKDLTMDEAVRVFKLSNDRDPISIEEVIEFFKNRKLSAKGGIIGLRNGGRPGYMEGEGPVMDGTVTSDAEGVKSKVSNELREQIEGNNLSSAAINDILYRFYEKFHPELTEETLDSIVAELQAEKVFEQKDLGILGLDKAMDMITPESVARSSRRISRGDTQYGDIPEMKKGGRVKRAAGGVMDLGGMEKDYRFDGGFVPLGEYEKKDDVPARLSKNEFVFTADAVRAAGGGSINKGAQKMYNTMKTLEAQPTAKRMTA